MYSIDNTLNQIARAIDEGVGDVVEEGHKAGLVGTAFLHAFVVIAAFMLAGVVGELILALIGLFGAEIGDWLPRALAIVVGLRVLWFYFKREFGKNGDFWIAHYTDNSRKRWDSVLDFLFPLVAMIFLIIVAV